MRSRIERRTGDGEDQSTEIGSFDRAAGLAFGVLRGILVVALLVLLVRQGDAAAATVDPAQDAIRGARTYPMYESVAKALEAVLPQARQRAHDIIDRQKGESAAIPPAAPAPEPAAAQQASPN